MKFAFVFPGQGSQSVGMLDAFADNPAVKATLEEASDVLKQDVGLLISKGPAEELGLTSTTQPVMLTAGVAIWRAWRAAGGAEPFLLAGHSLGEYAALVAAGALTFAEALPLVQFRARAMQSAVPVGVGGMAAILGMTAEAVASVCEVARHSEVVEPANFNDPGQTVISGHMAAVLRACELARAKGAKRAVPLSVSAPFHSSLMRPAADELAAYLATRPFAIPGLSVINNVDVAVNLEPGRIQDALVRQAAGAVRWVETIEKMRSQGVTHVIECGPGKVLAGLTRRIDRELVGAALIDPAALGETLEVLQC
jgi:[acyl-carrier-protein] S-malonyltransferase